MPFYVRKSISAGPFRFNLSKSGMGLSVGVKGLRFGLGPRGHYIHAGIGGLYYRATLGRAGQEATGTARDVDNGRVPRRSTTYEEPNVEMIEVESGDVLAMRDAQFDELLKEINEKHAQLSFAPIFAVCVGIIGFAATYWGNQAGLIVLAMALPAWAIGKWLDSYKRRTVLFYELEKEAAEAYEGMTRAFDALVSCAGKWRVEAGGAVRDLTTWKRNAGASHIVKKNDAKLGYAAPNAIATNITPPCIHIGRKTMYFFPDAAFIFDGKRVGAVGYDSLEVRWQESYFIEEGRVPHDAQVVSYTWKHPNKKGGPDRRFANNHQIPVCLYEVAHFTSDNGVNELLEFSRTGVVAPLASALRDVVFRTGRGNSNAPARLARPWGRPADLA